jgi:hypothetical protein
MVKPLYFAILRLFVDSFPNCPFAPFHPRSIPIFFSGKSTRVRLNGWSPDDYATLAPRQLLLSDSLAYMLVTPIAVIYAALYFGTAFDWGASLLKWRTALRPLSRHEKRERIKWFHAADNWGKKHRADVSI